MYPFIDLRSLLANRAAPMQFPQYQDRQIRPQQQQQNQQGGGGLDLGQMYEQFTGKSLPTFGELMQGGGFGAPVGGEAAPIGLAGSYAGAAPAAGAAAGEGLGAAGAGAAEGLGAAGAGAAEGLGAAGAGAAEGLGAAAGAAGEGVAAAGAGILDAIGGLIALMFSDPKVKENKAKVGQLYDGTPVWSYNYIGDPTPRIGLMANEVRPDAVYDIGGVKAVDYNRATQNARAIGILGDLGA